MKKTRANGPHIPADYDVSIVASIQALISGVAEPHQQQIAMKWIIEQASGMYEFQFYPTDRETAFALGRGFVGMQLVKLSKLNVSQMRKQNG